MNGPMDSYVKTGVGSRGWGNARVKVALVDKFDEADHKMIPGEIIRRISVHSSLPSVIQRKPG